MADERNRMLEQLNADDWQECRQSVLIVDDSAMNRRMLTEILGGRFDTAEATSGEECLHLLEENRDGISIVLLDIHMEGMDGFAVLEEMDRQKMLEDIPVIMISSEDKVDAMRRAFDLGASDYISRPFDARVVCHRIGNTMRLYAKQRRLCAAVEKQIREADQNSRIMLALLNRVMEKRNGESRNHVRRIQIITALLLAQLAQKNGQHWLTGAARYRQNRVGKPAAVQYRPDCGGRDTAAAAYNAGCTDAGRKQYPAGSGFCADGGTDLPLAPRTI